MKLFCLPAMGLVMGFLAGQGTKLPVDIAPLLIAVFLIYAALIGLELREARPVHEPKPARRGVREPRVVARLDRAAQSR